MDQHHSHEVLDLLMLAREEGIVIFFDLPPHTSHWLQPLDKSCFGPLTKRYNTACSQFMSKGPNYMVSKATFAKLFHQAWSETMVPHGFFVTGIYSFNSAAIPELPLPAPLPASSYQVQNQQIRPHRLNPCRQPQQ